MRESDNKNIKQEFTPSDSINKNYEGNSVLNQNIPPLGRLGKVIGIDVSGVTVGTVIRNTYGKDAIFRIDAECIIQYSIDGINYHDFEVIREYVGPSYGTTKRSFMVKAGDRIKFTSVSAIISLSAIL